MKNSTFNGEYIIMPERGMEGRSFGADGTDLGDSRFHAVGWNTTPNAADEDLQRIADRQVILAEQRVEELAACSRGMGARGFAGLLAQYPHHPQAAHWRSRLEDLR